jgi:hypothetical protein
MGIFFRLEHPRNHARFVGADLRGLGLQPDKPVNGDIFVPVPPPLLFRLPGQGHQPISERVLDPVNGAKIADVAQAGRAHPGLDAADLGRRAQQLPRHVLDRAARSLTQVAQLAGQLPTVESGASISSHVHAPAHLIANDATKDRTDRPWESRSGVPYLWQVPSVLPMRYGETLAARNAEVKRCSKVLWGVQGKEVPPGMARGPSGHAPAP